MPQVLALPFAFAPGWVSGTATAGSTIAGALGSKVGITLLTLGATVALSALLRPALPETPDQKLELQQAVPPRTFVYGRAEIAGSIAFNRTSPTHAGMLCKVSMFADGEIDAWETLKIDDIICLLDASGWVTNAFIQDAEKHVQIFLHNGSDDQAADPMLMAEFPGIWSGEHRLRGIAYAVVIAWGTSPENFQGAYPNGAPILKAVIRGRRVWDPRDPAQDPDVPASWMWSDNAPLCVLDWVSMHPKGYKIPVGKIDIDSFIAMADRADELVPLSTGGSEKRYRVSTQVSLKEPRTDVLARLREACDGHLHITDEGKWALRGGAWVAPDTTIDAKLGHLIDLEMTDGQAATTRYNELVLRFLNPNNGYAESECDPWQVEDDVEFAAGKVKSRPLDLLQVPSYTQARRLAKIAAAYDNPDFLGRAKTSFYGLNLIGEPNMTLNWSEHGEVGGAVDGPFWVESNLAMLDNGTGMQVSLRSCDPAAYDWDETTEEGAPVPLLPPTDYDSKYEEGVPPDNPVDFAATGGVRSVLLSWTPPGDDAFYIARVWRSASGAGFAAAVEVSGPRYQPRTPADLMTFYDPVAAGSYDYWLTVENPVGDRNTPVGPIAATATDVGEYFLLDDYGNQLLDDDGAFVTAEV